MWVQAVGQVFPAWELQPEAVVAPVFTMELEVESPRVVPFLQGLRVPLVGPLGFLSPLAYPNVTILGLNPKAPIRCQVWRIYLHL